MTTQATVSRSSPHSLAESAKATPGETAPPPVTRMPIQEVKSPKARRLGGNRDRKTPREVARIWSKLQGKFSLVQWLLLVGAGLFGLWLVGLLLISAFGWVSRLLTPAPLLQGEQLQVQLDRPPVTIPDPAEQPLAAVGPITVPIAQQVVETWLTAKAASFGQDYRTETLSSILVEPALSKQRQQVEAARAEGWYANYEHTVTIDGVEMSSTNPDQALVEATVKEKADFYQGSQLDTANSYDDQVRVQYRLVRQNNQWRIQDMSLL